MHTKVVKVTEINFMSIFPIFHALNFFCIVKDLKKLNQKEKLTRLMIETNNCFKWYTELILRWFENSVL